MEFPGLSAQEAQAAYRADPALNQSGIKMFLRDPQEYYQRCITRSLPQKPPTKAMQFGTDVEAFAFYERLPVVMIPQDVLQRRVVSGKEQFARAGAAWTEYETRQKLLHGEDVKLVKQEEFQGEVAPILSAVNSLREHKMAADLVFGNTAKHVRIKWTDDITGLQCKCEIDLVELDRGVIPDLKTAQDNSRSGFQRAVMNFGYYIQANFYRTALHELAEYHEDLPDTELANALRPLLASVRDGEQLLCCWIALKNKPSYSVEVYPVAQDWYSIAETITRDAMFQIAEAHRTGRWQTKTHGSAAELPCPAWAWNAVEELSSGEE